jgi:hypothetical protein
MLSIGGEMPFMGAPAELGGLRALADKPVDRPGVDEFPRLLGDRRDLRVALGDMDGLDAEPLGEFGPAGALLGRLRCRVSRARDIDERLLDKVGDQPGIGAVGDDRGRATRAAGSLRERALAQRVVGARRRRQTGVGIAARPRLDAGVEIERAPLPAIFDQRHG